MQLTQTLTTVMLSAATRTHAEVAADASAVLDSSGAASEGERGARWHSHSLVALFGRSALDSFTACPVATASLTATPLPAPALVLCALLVGKATDCRDETVQVSGWWVVSSHHPTHPSCCVLSCVGRATECRDVMRGSVHTVGLTSGYAGHNQTCLVLLPSMPCRLLTLFPCHKPHPQPRPTHHRPPH